MKFRVMTGKGSDRANRAQHPLERENRKIALRVRFAPKPALLLCSELFDLPQSSSPKDAVLRRKQLSRGYFR